MLELLSRLVSKVNTIGMVKGFSSGVVGPLVPLIQFADNSLFLLGEAFKRLRSILLIVEVALGLKVNLSKSMIYSVGQVPNIDSFSEILGCSIQTLPSSYSGLPLGDEVASNVVWNPVIEWMEKRFSGWKGRYLSKGGQLTGAV